MSTVYYVKLAHSEGFFFFFKLLFFLASIFQSLTDNAFRGIKQIQEKKNNVNNFKFSFR